MPKGSPRRITYRDMYMIARALGFTPEQFVEFANEKFAGQKLEDQGIEWLSA